MRIIALCKLCHLTTHYGFSRMNGMKEKVSSHLKKIRNFNLEELNEHINTAYATWLERNQYEWNLDLSMITLNNYEIVKPVKIENRKKISYFRLNKLDKSNNSDK